MATVECPCDGCEYEGTVSGVEAHVSGSTRGDHGGRSGGEFRDRLIEEAEAGAAGEPEMSPATAIVASTLALVLIVVVMDG
jgi:hypothetical protein